MLETKQSKEIYQSDIINITYIINADFKQRIQIIFNFPPLPFHEINSLWQIILIMPKAEKPLPAKNSIISPISCP